MKISIKYNAPLTLTYSLIAFGLLLLDSTLFKGIIPAFFAVPGRSGFEPGNILHYISLLTYVLGHDGWPHLMGNLAYILLLGPILEEKHGTLSLLLMMLTAALATGLLNILIFPNGLMGGSGIVFMMIILASFTNFRNGELPLTFILIVIIYLTGEIMNIAQTDNISQFAHIVGGVLGALFGFLNPRRRKTE